MTRPASGRRLVHRPPSYPMTTARSSEAAAAAAVASGAAGSRGGSTRTVALTVIGVAFAAALVYTTMYSSLAASQDSALAHRVVVCSQLSEDQVDKPALVSGLAVVDGNVCMLGGGEPSVAAPDATPASDEAPGRLMAYVAEQHKVPCTALDSRCQVHFLRQRSHERHDAREAEVTAIRNAVRGDATGSTAPHLTTPRLESACSVCLGRTPTVSSPYCKWGVEFFGKCFCEGGFSGERCDAPSPRLANCEDDADRCSYSETAGIAVVGSVERWTVASASELKGWASSKNDQDRAEEHIKEFGSYDALPSDLGHVAEFGSGPFTQTLFMLEQDARFTADSVTLFDPNLYDYLESVRHCRYKDCRLSEQRVPTFLVNTGGEDAAVCELFDTVVMINVIEHAWNAFQVFQNLYDALKPGGHLVFHDRYWDRVFDDGSYWRAGYAKVDTIGLEKHPIRVSRMLLETFMAQFVELYRNIQDWGDGKDAPNRKGQVGYYVILRKPVAGEAPAGAAVDFVRGGP